MSIHPPSQDAVEAAVGSPPDLSPRSTQMRARALEAVACARDLLDRGEAESAMQKLRPVFDEDRAHAQVRSYYGLTLGLARRRSQEALDLCQSAVKQEFFNPDLYVNVARLNLAFGFKAESLRYLRRARMIDPGSAAINRMLEELGPRATPVLSFLPRRHLLNRWLGNARYALSQRTLRPMPPEKSSPADQAVA